MLPWFSAGVNTHTIYYYGTKVYPCSLRLTVFVIVDALTRPSANLKKVDDRDEADERRILHGIHAYPLVIGMRSGGLRLATSFRLDSRMVADILTGIVGNPA